MALPSLEPRSWTRDGYFLSTDPKLVSLEALNEAFALPDLYWAKQLSTEELRALVDHSVCFSLHAFLPDGQLGPMIGFARLISDRVTFAYLTDVYVLPSHQKSGLGSWMIDCVNQWTELMPNLRQLVLIASIGSKEEYYGRKMGMGRMENTAPGIRLLNRKGPGFPI